MFKEVNGTEPFTSVRQEWPLTLCRLHNLDRRGGGDEEMKVGTIFTNSVDGTNNSKAHFFNFKTFLKVFLRRICLKLVRKILSVNEQCLSRKG